jgi:Raf kinase inhibitor-like YbhB/YbcL family protein
LTSPAFTEGETIPQKFSCDGEDISPELNWTDPPMGTQSFALIMDDPDAPHGTWVHWVLYNIPPETRFLPENIPAEPTLSDGSVHGKNSFERFDYGGPCPPPGRTHRYFFKLYALDAVLDGFPYMYILEEHMLAETQLMGTYSR